jgi:hypothetical protein
LPDILVDTRSQIERRLRELRPLVAEHERLQAAHDALARIPSAAAPARDGRKRGPGRPKATASTKRKVAKPRRRTGRRKGSGTRGAQALEIITGQPGITIPEIAAKMGIKQNYLYRVLPGLQKEKRVRKDGKGWHPVG